MEVAIERSAGKFDFHQLTEAYRYFGFNVDSSPSDDAHIIGTFQSRMQDAPMQAAQMREQLRIIGTHRNSTKILHIAEDGKALVYPGARNTGSYSQLSSRELIRTSSCLSQGRADHGG